MRENVWKNYNEKEKEELEKLCADYMQFLSDCKTERECVKDIVQRAKLAGYKSLEEVMEQKKRLKSGDKVYAVCMQKAVALLCIGTEPMEKGLNILGAHIDSPRLDVKQNPLYEDGDMAYLDTHYYGGIKKYQWVTLPLAIHGVVVKKDGSSVQIHIGEKEEDPVFCVSDLLIHLAGEQMEKKAGKVIEGENLDLLVGSIPLESEEKDAVKKGVLAILSKEYGMEEEDFISAELEIVPAGKARELGFDDINMDLIMGLPEESLEDVRDTLEQIMQLKPDNLTVHSLALKRAARLNMFKEDYKDYKMVNTQEHMDLTASYAKKMDLFPYYLYRQKGMAGNLENVGYAKEGKAGVYNILIMEEKQTIVACGAGASTKRVWTEPNPDGTHRIERCENVKDVGQYIERIDEMIERKQKLFAEE